MSAIIEKTIANNRDVMDNQACMLLHDIHVIYYFTNA